MAVQSRARVLELEQIGEVTVARFVVPSLLGDEPAQEVGKQLLSLVKDQGCRKLVLDFANVERMSTMTVNKIVGVYRALKAEDGRLALCRIRPSVREIFTILTLDRILRIYEDEQRALESF